MITYIVIIATISVVTLLATIDKVHSIDDLYKIPQIMTSTSKNNLHENHINNTSQTQIQEVPTSIKFLFNVIPKYDNTRNIISYAVKLDPKFMDLYKKVGFADKSKNVAFIYPFFTQAAYGKGGFYDYYKKQCDVHCLTVSIPTQIIPGFSSSISSYYVLSLLNYSQITDVDVDKNPNILKKYDKIIVLHNEYVTQKEFDAITHHPNVMYLYPNALYAKVETNYDKNTITLIKGHGYPTSSTSNGFGWKYDDSKYEKDTKCSNWQFIKISNGSMLNCYPSSAILKDQSLLYAIKI
jgi:hypothetical protein